MKGPKESRITIRRDDDQGLVSSEDKSRHIVPAALLVRVQCYRKDLYKAVEGPSTRPIVICVNYFQFRRRLTILDETKFAALLTHLSL